MAYELVYTSAPEGLNRGSSGFCVVACTRGLGPRLIVTLEGLSAYKPLYPHYAPNAWDNPVSRSHYLYTANGEQHILSRICFNGVDHTQRSNKLASHLVLNEKETVTAAGGPSSVLLHEELFKDASWPIKAEYYPTQKVIPATENPVKKCFEWENVMGDAGWGGYLAQLYLNSPGKNVYIAYNPEQNQLILPLLNEALSLLPEGLRWKVTFSTYFVNLPAGMSCTWRGCLANSDVLKTAYRSPSNVIVDITKPRMLEQNSKLIQQARTGIAEVPQPTVLGSQKNEQLKLKKPTLKLNKPAVTLKVPKPISISQTSPVPHTKAMYDSVEEPIYDEETQSVWKPVSIIAGIILLLSGFIFGMWWWVFVPKEAQKKYQMRLENIKAAGDFQKSSQLEPLIKEIEGKINSGNCRFNNLKKVREDCRNYKDQLEKAEEQRKAEAKKKAEEQRKAEAKKKAEEQRKAEAKKKAEEQRKAEAKKKKKQAQDAKRKQSSTKIAVKQMPKDDPHYLWEKSKDLHNLQAEDELKIQVGNVTEETMKIEVYPKVDVKKRKDVGKITWQDSDYKEYDLPIELKDGILKIKPSTKNKPEKYEFCIIIDGRDYPLYFRVDVSKIKSKGKNKEFLKLRDDGELYLSKDAFILPEKFYKRDSHPVKDDEIKWRIRKGSDLIVELKKDDHGFTFKWVTAKVKGLQERQKHLDEVKNKIGECEISNIADIVPNEESLKGKKGNVRDNEEAFQYVCDKMTLKELVKIESLKEHVKGLNESWKSEKEKIDNELQKCKNELPEEDLKQAELFLVCDGVEYKQLSLSEILP